MNKEHWNDMITSLPNPHLLQSWEWGEVKQQFGWTAFQHLEPDRIEVVEMPKEQQVLRGTGVGMLSFAKDADAARKFMDFLTTPEARAFYKEFGWVVS